MHNDLLIHFLLTTLNISTFGEKRELRTSQKKGTRHPARVAFFENNELAPTMLNGHQRCLTILSLSELLNAVITQNSLFRGFP